MAYYQLTAPSTQHQPNACRETTAKSRNADLCPKLPLPYSKVRLPENDAEGQGSFVFGIWYFAGTSQFKFSEAEIDQEMSREDSRSMCWSLARYVKVEGLELEEQFDSRTAVISSSCIRSAKPKTAGSTPTVSPESLRDVEEFVDLYERLAGPTLHVIPKLSVPRNNVVRNTTNNPCNLQDRHTGQTICSFIKGSHWLNSVHSNYAASFLSSKPPLCRRSTLYENYSKAKLRRALGFYNPFQVRKHVFLHDTQTPPTESQSAQMQEQVPTEQEADALLMSCTKGGVLELMSKRPRDDTELLAYFKKRKHREKTLQPNISKPKASKKKTTVPTILQLSSHTGTRSLILGKLIPPRAVALNFSETMRLISNCRIQSFQDLTFSKHRILSTVIDLPLKLLMSTRNRRLLGSCPPGHKILLNTSIWWSSPNSTTCSIHETTVHFLGNQLTSSWISASNSFIPCVKQLGLELTPTGGTVAKSPFNETNVSGLFVAGNSCSPSKVVWNGLYTGNLAGTGVFGQILEDRWVNAKFIHSQIPNTLCV
ncbi:uncharacterized protein BDR25DRAFT_359918 [Lindgomyces ingoldianus]|uniref:Uncharacterized protein n=1 Tax=Lindgomyces ingoldianus TaxID=673940 RepID=A0ACB6QI03_9PLEO|nr:uncharacterized protein BDR25DRAFT_359918 [Lindgomyces ingoldianus]KAF2466135.1 hypothetical protein BDR25DRAFT_359918 [Lindgomyces ingoldianus]